MVIRITGKSLHGTETCSTGGSAGRPVSLVDFARHSDPRHGTVTRITGESLHGTESGMARRLAALVNVARHGDPHHWWIAARDGARRGTETRRTRGRLLHGKGLCTVFILARHYSARYLAPCKTVALDIASHRTSRAALRDCTQTVLTFY